MRRNRMKGGGVVRLEQFNNAMKGLVKRLRGNPPVSSIVPLNVPIEHQPLKAEKERMRRKAEAHAHAQAEKERRRIEAEAKAYEEHRKERDEERKEMIKKSWAKPKPQTQDNTKSSELTPTTIDNVYLTNYMNGMNGTRTGLDLLKITKIDLKVSLTNTQKRVLLSIAPQLLYIETIILVNLDLTDIVDLLQILKTPNKIKKLLLIPRENFESSNTSAIFDLLNLIDKEMNGITHFEFSNFKIDISDFLKSSKNVDFVELFSQILGKTQLQYVTFNNNIFKDDVKANYYSEFTTSYRNESTVNMKFGILLNWVIRHPSQNPDTYKYKKWLEWIIYKHNTKKSLLSYDEITKIITKRNMIDKNDMEMDDIKDKRFLEVWKSVNKGFYNGLKNENNALNEFLSKKSNEFQNVLNSIDKNDVDKKEWFKWLLLDNREAGIVYTDEHDDIVERLVIVSECLYEGIVSRDIEIIGVLDEGNKDKFLYMLEASMLSFFNKQDKERIIELFDNIFNKYNPSESKLTKEYNEIIASLAKANGKKAFRYTKLLDGGRKTKTKVALKAPKKPPKALTKTPPKALTKTPKQSTKPKVARKAPKKTPKQPPKAPKVARKAPTKTPKVARKVNKKK